MCQGIALSGTELPTELIGRYGLSRRAHSRGGETEFHFMCWDWSPRLPILRDGQLQIVRWGNRRRQSRHLPATSWTWLDTVREGGWRHIPSVPVEIPATYAREGRGVWYLVERGIRGLLVPDERGAAVAYMICEPSSHYYQVMTGSPRMPVLIDQRI